MNFSMRTQTKSRPLSTRLWRVLGAVAALPFLSGAAVIALRLVRTDGPVGYITMGRLLGSALFAFGMSLGLIGSVFALTSRSRYTRTLWAALTLFGCSHLILGFAAMRTVERITAGAGPSVVPFLAPAALWACSVGLALKAHGDDSKQDNGGGTG